MTKGRHRNPAHGLTEVLLLGVAERIVRHPVLVIVTWLVAIAVATPFALQLPSVLTEQGASKVVAGTESAAAEELIERSFPHRSERQALLVISAPDVRGDGPKRVLAELDRAISERVRSGEVDQTASAFTLHRDATMAFLDQTRVRLDRDSARLDALLRQLRADPRVLGAARAGRPLPAAVARTIPASARPVVERLLPLLADGPPARHVLRGTLIDELVRIGEMPAQLARLVRSAEAFSKAATTRLAAEFAQTAEWTKFPLPVPAAAAERLISSDARVALVSVSFARDSGTGPDADPDVEWLRGVAASVVRAQDAGGAVAVNVTGELVLIHDTYERADADNELMEAVAYLVIAVVLLLFFRAILPTVITIVCIGLAMNVSQAALYALGRQVTLTQFTVTIMTFVMLGAGIDYSMLLSSRYRQERLAGHPVREAVVNATARAGESVLLAGTAVVLAFSATLLAPVDWIPPLGYGGLIGIPIILLAAFTLTPSLLMLLGDRFFWLGWKPLTDFESNGVLSRHLRRLSALARRWPVAVTAVFLVATVPFAALVATHASTADPVALSPDTDSRRGFTLVAEKWGKATLFPTVVVGPLDARLRNGDGLSPEGHAALERLATRIADLDGVARVDSVTRPFGTPWPAAEVGRLPADLRRDYLAADGSARLAVTLRGDPFAPSAAATARAVDEVVTSAGGAVGALAVGGATRVDEEYADALRSSFWQMVALVSVGVFVMLLIALRSILVPVRLIATIMMSNVWAVAATVLLFETFGLGGGAGVINDLPIFLVILMMGLGMDYEIFLMTRIRDLVRQGSTDEAATMTALLDTGRVINAAGLVMAGSLGAMTLSSTLMLQQYGVGLGTAVLLDATLIRMLLVPATLLLFRRYNWWLPRLRLARIRPSLVRRPDLRDTI